MAIAKTDWEQYRATNSDILPDIFFRVLQDRDENIETEAQDENEDKAKMIRAHKMLLAGASPVFKANFFGPMKMTGEVMEVRETTIEAFNTLINFIYWPPGKPAFSLKYITCFEELCNIVEISERYQIMDLKQLAKEAIQNLKVTAKDVIIVATVANRYKAFEDIQEILMSKNVAYLEKTMKSANDVISFLIETRNDFPENGVEVLIDLFKEKQKRDGNKDNINGWGTIYSKAEEHKIETCRLTEINKPCKQWRIKHDFKPTSYEPKEQNWTLTATIGSMDPIHGCKVIMYVGFNAACMYIICQSPWPIGTHVIREVPRIGKWTTIDIINEELEPRKFTLTVLFGGRQVYREERAGRCNLNTAQIKYANHTVCQPGFIRNLSIMTSDKNDEEDNEDIENENNQYNQYIDYNEYYYESSDYDDNDDNDANDYADYVNEHF